MTSKSCFGGILPIAWVAVGLLAGCSSKVSGPNRAPVARAGGDATVGVDERAELDGSGSYDPDGDELGYTWTLLARPQDGRAELLADAGARTALMPDAEGVWVVALVVNDGRRDSARDVVQVRAERPCQCDDGLYCTVDDACAAGGECTGAARDCSEAGDACNDGVCDDDLDDCVTVQRENGTECDDGDGCTMDDVCSSGVCSGQPLDADGDGYLSDACAGNDCDDDNPEINPGQYEAHYNDPICSDGLDNDCDGLTDGDDTAGCFPCALDSDCDDANQCNGQESCDGDMCMAGEALDCDDGDVCTDDTCLPASGCDYTYNTAPCDDLLFCTFNDSCDGDGWCVGSGTPCATECRTVCDEALDSCEPDPAGTPCIDDGVFCNGPEACNDAGLCASTGNPCAERDCNHCQEAGDTCFDPADTPCSDDGVFCNGPEGCDGDGACVPQGNPCPGTECNNCNEDMDTCFDPPGLPCADDGTFCNGPEGCDGAGNCAPQGSPCAETDCNHCQEAEGTCFDPAGIACSADDGYDCTTSAECDGAGACLGVIDDVYCDDLNPGNGDLCWPSCSPDASGCVTPPGSMDLACDDPVHLGTTDVSGCTITLAGGDNTGQEACLPCSARVGMLTLARADFGDDIGACDLDGWRLVPGELYGDFCKDGVAGCAETGGAKDCCDQLAAICTTLDGNYVLKSDKDTNCGNKKEEWRLERTFDFRGLSDIEVCFAIADIGVDNNNQGILVHAYDNNNVAELIFCQNNAPRTGVDGVFYPFCAPLPGWAIGKPAVTIRFIVHSENGGKIMYLDDISVRGWYQGCAPDRTTLFTETFDGCDLSDWTVTSGTPECPGNFICDGSSGNLGSAEVAGGDTWIIERTVDAYSLDGDVQLCFDLGGRNANNSSDMIKAEFDAGTGWETAWSQDSEFGDNSTCANVCVNLSEINPAVKRNRALSIRFTVASDAQDDYIALDNVSLSGAQYCDGADIGAVQLGALSDGGAGTYTFTATNTAGEQLGADITCSWEPDVDLESSDSIWYIPPLLNPSNIDEPVLQLLCANTADLVVDSAATIDTDAGTITDVDPGDIVFNTISQGGGAPDIGVFSFNSVDIQADVTVTGSNALALIACEDVRVDALIDASASGQTSGPGGYGGGDGQADGSGYSNGEGLHGFSEGSPYRETGGGGGGFGFSGGNGGDSDTRQGGAGGQENGTDELVSLVGGSGGGSGGFLSNLSDEGGVGGGGGGAVQISAGGDLVVTAAGGVHAGGAGGGAGPPEWSSGGGGGAGGAILLEGVTVTVAGTLAANGGGGGGADTTFDSACAGGGPGAGQDGPYGDSQAAGGRGCDTDNRDGGPGGAGGYGAEATGAGVQPADFHVSGVGGGAAGRIRLNSHLDGYTTITGTLSPHCAGGQSSCTRGAITVY